MEPAQHHGTFSWCELITSDVAAAREFYGQLLGWTFKDRPSGSAPYTVIETTGREIGGMAPPPSNQPQMPPTWGVYITVDDVDAIAEKATSLGGQVLMPPITVKSVGRFSLIKDPQGAIFCAIEYEHTA